MPISRHKSYLGLDAYTSWTQALPNNNSHRQLPYTFNHRLTGASAPKSGHTATGAVIYFHLFQPGFRLSFELAKTDICCKPRSPVHCTEPIVKPKAGNPLIRFHLVPATGTWYSHRPNPQAQVPAPTYLQHTPYTTHWLDYI